MGREIRRVPPDWEHPLDEYGMLTPMQDVPYEVAAQMWWNEAVAWEEGTHPELRGDGASLKEEYFWYWEYDAPPQKEGYRPNWPEGTMTAYQIYETVSEGTPVSPVFRTEDEIVEWLVEQGYSEHASKEFVKEGWAPSFTSFGGGRLLRNIESYDER